MTNRPGLTPFYFDQFSDELLTAVYQSGKAWLTAAPTLSTEIGSAIHNEIERRFWNVTDPASPKEPAPPALHLDRWSQAFTPVNGDSLSWAVTLAARA